MDKLSVKDFAARLKAKYPDYASIDDLELTKRIIAKYPEYGAKVDMGGQFQEAPEAAAQVPASTVPRTQPNAIQQFLRGMGKGYVGDISSMLGMSDSMLGANIADFAKPGTPVESSGKQFAQATEYFAPQPLLTKIVKFPQVAQTLAKLGPGSKSLITAGQEALGAGLISSIQGGKPEDVAKAAAIAGVGGLVSEPIGKGLDKLGRRITLAAINPRSTDIVDGFDINNVQKYGLGGNLQNAFFKTVAKLKELRDTRNALINPNITVDMRAVFTDYANALGQEVGEMKVIGKDVKAIKKALTDLKKTFLQAAPTGVVDLKKAENFKESLGQMGAFLYKHPDPEAKPLEKVANDLYFKVKALIEANTPAQLQGLNKQMSELIPIKNALLSRIPVEEKQHIFRLTDILTGLPAAISGDPLRLAWWATYRASTEPSVGKFLMEHGQQASGLARTVGKLLSSRFGKESQ